MKRLFYILVVCSGTLLACSKSDTALQADNGCIERTFLTVTAHSINRSDVSIVNNLFSSNGIDNSHFRYYQYIHDTLKTLYPPYTKYDEKVVRIEQYINNQRIFTGTLVYHFLNDILKDSGGKLTGGTSLDTIPKLTLGQIRKRFIDDIEKFDHAGNIFQDTCFKAEFGYFNLNSGISNAQEALVKAWKVTPKNSTFPSAYPVAYYQDNDGKLINYDNGIRTFK